MLYLVLGFGIELQKTSVNGQQGTMTTTTPIIWEGVINEPNSAGNYIEESTSFDQQKHTFVQHYKFHVELPDDANIVTGLDRSGRYLSSATDYATALSVWNNCSRIVAHYIFGTLLEFISRCGGKVDEINIEVDAFDPVSAAKNQVLIRDDNTVYLKMSANVNGKEEVYEYERSFAMLLLDSFKTGDIFDMIRVNMNLPEPDMSEKQPTTEIDTSDMEFDTENIEDDPDDEIDQDEIDAINEKLGEDSPNRIDSEKVLRK